MSIPAFIRASSAVSRGERHAGELRLQDLPRLASAAGAETRLRVEWIAGRDAGNAPELHGRIEGCLRLICLSCGAAFDWPVQLNPRLRLVHSEREEAGLMQDSDPYRIEDDRLPLRELTEEEVLLALPLMPRCETCENGALGSVQARTRENPDRPNPVPSPFAALKKLKL